MKTDALKRTKRTGSTIVKILALFVFWQLCVLNVYAQIIETSFSHYFVGKCRPQDSSYYRDYDGNNFLPETDFAVTIDEDKKEILIGGRDNDVIAEGIFSLRLMSSIIRMQYLRPTTDILPCHLKYT